RSRPLKSHSSMRPTQTAIRSRSRSHALGGRTAANSALARMRLSSERACGKAVWGEEEACTSAARWSTQTSAFEAESEVSWFRKGSEETEQVNSGVETVQRRGRESRRATISLVEGFFLRTAARR